MSERTYCDLADVRELVCPPGELPNLELVQRITGAITTAAATMNGAFRRTGARMPYGVADFRNARRLNAYGAAAIVRQSATEQDAFRAMLAAMCVALGGADPAEEQQPAPGAPGAATTGDLPAAAVEVAAPHRAARRASTARRDEA